MTTAITILIVLIVGFVIGWIFGQRSVLEIEPSLNVYNEIHKVAVERNDLEGRFKSLSTEFEEYKAYAQKEGEDLYNLNQEFLKVRQAYINRGSEIALLESEKEALRDKVDSLVRQVRQCQLAAETKSMGTSEPIIVVPDTSDMSTRTR